MAYLEPNCVNCGEKFFFQIKEAGSDTREGQCYTREGWAETSLSGYCEYCFDRLIPDLYLGNDDVTDPFENSGPWGD